jgi:DNA-binding SARP family transcriptional activator
MAAHRGERGAQHRTAVTQGQPEGARAGLTEAVAELRRLAQDPFLRSVERALADPGDAPSGSSAGIEAVRALRRWGAEYLRVADELETAARSCRLVEREIGERIDAFLMGWEGQPGTADKPGPGGPAAPRRRNGLKGWLRELFRRERPRDGPGTALSRNETPPILPRASPHPHRPPGPGAPPADIAALVLGPLELSVAGRRVLRWNSLKARAVFQYLLIHQDRPVRRDVLMELQWPDHTHNSARNNLNVALYSLRNTLDGPGQGVQPIVYQDGCYSLNPQLKWCIDRNEFIAALRHAESARRAGRPQQAIDAYQAAIQLYRGPLFEDDPAGDWFLPEQRHLEGAYLQALAYLATSYFDRGQLSEAVHFGQLAVVTDSCCEPMHRLLMRCFGSQHQQQLVCRQYRSCVDALRDELGVPPGEETVQLFRDLTATV